MLPSSSPQVQWPPIEEEMMTKMTQGLLKAPSNLFPSHHAGFPPLRPPSQVGCSRRPPSLSAPLNPNLITLQPTPGSQSNSPSDFGTQQNWSFEEQFKQVGVIRSHKCSAKTHQTFI